MTISDKEMAALQNLADTQAGKEVGWTSIADARALTALGLARRAGGGWEITPQGLALIRSEAGGPTLIARNDAAEPDVGPQLPANP